MQNKKREQANVLKRRRQVVARKALRSKRPLHRKVLLHPVSLFALLCTGVILADTTWHSLAATIYVHAKVSAPFLTQPAVITNPADGAVFTSIPITVTGTCPANSYVKLFRNNTFSGVDTCSNSSFSIATDLFPGANQLRAQDYNTTDDAGPSSSGVTVTYNLPAPLPPPKGNPVSTAPVTNNTAGSGSIAGPLLLTAAFRYQVFHAGQAFQWDLGISGGTPPYTIKKIWGDGSSSSGPVGNVPELTINHRYSAAGRYVILLEATDASGSRATLQLMAIIDDGTAPPGAAAVGGFSSNSGPLSSQWLWVLVPAYSIVVLMAASFYLGEREEWRKLKQPVRRRHATRTA